MQTTDLAKAAASSADRLARAGASARVTRIQVDASGPWATHTVLPSNTCKTAPAKGVPGAGSGAAHAAGTGAGGAGHASGDVPTMGAPMTAAARSPVSNIAIAIPPRPIVTGLGGVALLRAAP